MQTQFRSGISKKWHAADFAQLQHNALHIALFSTKQLHGFKTATKDPKWFAAMKEEMHALHTNDTWSAVPWPKSSNVVGSNWVFHTKCHSDGSVDLLKAQLVAQCFTQVLGLDYNLTFSLVVKASILHIVLSLFFSISGLFINWMSKMHFWMDISLKGNSLDMFVSSKKDLYGLK